jgi:DNA-binding winged helix-turn-helix (wHTH) protein/tetratricopeptide (TPR) repeat protein
MASPRYRFGDFEIDASRFELRRRGRPIEMQPKPLEVLLYLVRHRDRIVSRQELLAELWRGVTVSEDSLDKAVSASRRALGDTGDAQTCIRTVRGRGFRFVARVEEVDVAPSVPAETTAAPEAGDFVGREDVLARIAAAIDAARGGRGRLVLLTGDAGMGKTRTAHEAAARARRAGVRVLTGWCHEDEAAPSLWPWLHVLRPLVAEGDAADLARELGEATIDLAELLPELRAHAPSSVARAVVDPQQARFRLFDTLVRLVKHAVRDGPHLVVLDDFHWADAASISLLGSLTRELPESRLVLLVTHRPADLPPRHKLVELARRPECETLALTGLGRAEVARLIEAVHGKPVDDATADAIWERTEGNPFFVRELTRDLATERRFGATHGGSLPAGVRDVLRKRLDKLTPRSRALLTAGATIGREFALDLLASLFDVPSEDLLEVLDDALAEQIVVPVAGGYRFAHALVREVLLDEVSSAERVRLHRRIGAALEARYGDGVEDHLAEVAHHFHAGAVSGDRERALDYLRRAGARAVGLFAYEEAVEHYRKALEVWALLEHPEQRLRCELLLALGEAQIGAGRTEDGRASLAAAGDLARRLALPEHLARAALSYGGLEFSVEVWIEDPELVARLEEALAAVPQTSALRVRLLVRLGVALAWAREPERAPPLIAEAVDAARALGEPEPLAHALYVHRWGLTGPHELAARLADSDEILRLARESGRRELELVARSCRFLDLVELGRIVDADRELVCYERLAEALRMPRYRWRSQFYGTMRTLLEGRFAEAEERAIRSLGEGFRPADASLVAGPQLFVVRLEQGRIGEVEPLIRELARRFPTVPSWQANLALVDAELGRAGEAADALAALAADDFRSLSRPLVGLISRVIAAEVCTALGDVQRASVLYRQLAPYAPRTVVIGAGVACLGALDLYLGRLAATMGDVATARRHLEAALAMNTQLGALPWVAWAHYELGRLGAAASGERTAARHHLERARQIAAELGMGRLAARPELRTARPD